MCEGVSDQQCYPPSQTQSCPSSLITPSFMPCDEDLGSFRGTSDPVIAPVPINLSKPPVEPKKIAPDDGDESTANKEGKNNKKKKDKKDKDRKDKKCKDKDDEKPKKKKSTGCCGCFGGGKKKKKKKGKEGEAHPGGKPECPCTKDDKGKKKEKPKKESKKDEKDKDSKKDGKDNKGKDEYKPAAKEIKKPVENCPCVKVDPEKELEKKRKKAFASFRKTAAKAKEDREEALADACKCEKKKGCCGNCCGGGGKKKKKKAKKEKKEEKCK